RIGPRAWRLIHWISYASWPLAVVHGLGTGSDSQEPWMLGLSAACMAAVLVTLAQRLVAGRIRTVPVRLASGVVVVMATYPIRGPWVLRRADRHRHQDGGRRGHRASGHGRHSADGGDHPTRTDGATAAADGRTK